MKKSNSYKNALLKRHICNREEDRLVVLSVQSVFSDLLEINIIILPYIEENKK